MGDEPKPKEDLKQGLSLIFRAAKGAAKKVDIGKIDKSLDKAFSQVGRVVTNVGRVVGEEINRMANNPPWQKGETPESSEGKDKGEEEGQVHASTATEENKGSSERSDKKPDPDSN